jgi:hypothetical protein
MFACILPSHDGARIGVLVVEHVAVALPRRREGAPLRRRAVVVILGRRSRLVLVLVAIRRRLRSAVVVRLVRRRPVGGVVVVATAAVRRRVVLVDVALRRPGPPHRHRRRRRSRGGGVVGRAHARAHLVVAHDCRRRHAAHVAPTDASVVVLHSHSGVHGLPLLHLRRMLLRFRFPLRLAGSLLRRCRCRCCGGLVAAADVIGAGVFFAVLGRRIRGLSAGARLGLRRRRLRVARLRRGGLGRVGGGAALLGRFAGSARLRRLVVLGLLLPLALSWWCRLLLLLHRLLRPQLRLLAGLAQLGDQHVGVELRRDRRHDLVAPGIDFASVHALNRIKNNTNSAPLPITKKKKKKQSKQERGRQLLANKKKRHVLVPRFTKPVKTGGKPVGLPKPLGCGFG